MNTQVLTRPLPRPATRTATRAPAAPATPADRHGDDAIRRAVLERLAAQPWWDDAHANVFVDGGTVVLQGLADGRAARAAARRVALSVSGVRDVWDARVPRREWQALA
jgi:osmotically-inducible protein OsmY